MALELSQQQGEGVKAFGAWFREQRFSLDTDIPFFLMGGYAGTGKSSILPNLIQETGLDLSRIAIVAPTGKAVNVIRKKLAAQGLGALVPSTIHSAIYRYKPVPIESLEDRVETLKLQVERAIAANGSPDRELKETYRLAQMDLERAYDSANPKFQLNVDSNIRNTQLVIVDEASMVGEEIAADLRSFGRPVLAIGDPGQLQPVNASPGFFHRAPDVFLTEVHRQAKDNPILWFATLLRQGESIPMGHHDERLKVVRPREDRDTYDMERDIQVICGTNRTRWEINRQSRALCGFGATGPVRGELMICTNNSKKIMGLVNGGMMLVEKDVGELVSGDTYYPVTARDESGTVHNFIAVQSILEENYLGKDGSPADKRDIYRAKGKCEHLDWAYAITAHKSQGSQWDDVVVHDESEVFREERNKWAYTAATRAAERLTWVV